MEVNIKVFLISLWGGCEMFHAPAALHLGNSRFFNGLSEYFSQLVNKREMSLRYQSKLKRNIKPEKVKTSVYKHQNMKTYGKAR